jgi:hypothetical protein
MLVRKYGRGKCSRKEPGGNSTMKPAETWLASSPKIDVNYQTIGEERPPFSGSRF